MLYFFFLLLHLSWTQLSTFISSQFSKCYLNLSIIYLLILYNLMRVLASDPTWEPCSRALHNLKVLSFGLLTSDQCFKIRADSQIMGAVCRGGSIFFFLWGTEVWMTRCCTNISFFIIMYFIFVDSVSISEKISDVMSLVSYAMHYYKYHFTTII